MPGIVVRGDDPPPARDTPDDGEFAQSADMWHITVWAGASIAGRGYDDAPADSHVPLELIGTVTNYSALYQSADLTRDLGVLYFEYESGQEALASALPRYAFERSDVAFPLFGKLVGFGSTQEYLSDLFQVVNDDSLLDNYVQRASDVTVVEESSALTHADGTYCGARRDSGAFKLQTVVADEPVALVCLSTGDFGAPLFAPGPRLATDLTDDQGMASDEDWVIVGLASSADRYPCAERQAWFSSTRFRQEWIDRSIDVLEGRSPRVPVCPSATPSVTSVPTLTATPTMTLTASPSPSPYYEPVPPRRILWGLIITVMVLLLGMCTCGIAFGRHYRRKRHVKRLPTLEKSAVPQVDVEARRVVKVQAAAPKLGSKLDDSPAGDELLDAMDAEKERIDRIKACNDTAEARARSAREKERRARVRERARQKRRGLANDHNERFVAYGNSNANRFSTYSGQSAAERQEAARRGLRSAAAAHPSRTRRAHAPLVADDADGYRGVQAAPPGLP